MEWGVFLETAKILGLPLTMTLAAIFAYQKNWIITSSQHNEMRKEKDEQIRKAEIRSAELWDIVKPTILIGAGALDRLEERDGRRNTGRTR